MAKQKIKVQKGTVKKVLGYVSHYKGWLILSLCMAALSVAGTLYFPVLSGNAIDCIIAQGRVDFTAIGGILQKMVILVLATACVQWIMNVCNNHITYEVVRELREDAFRKIEILPLSYLDSHPSGDIVSRVISDADQFSDGLLMGFTQLFTGVLTIFGTIGFMLSINLWITLVVVLVTPLSFFVAGFIARRTHRMFTLQSQTRGEQTALIDEVISNQKVVQAFGKTGDTQKRFDEINEQLGKYSLQAVFFSSLTNPCTRFVNSVVYCGVALTGALLCISTGGSFSVGQLTCLLSYANQYTKPFNEISGVVTELQNALACAGRLLELIEEEPQIPDDPDAVILEHPAGEIRISDVQFSYDKSRELIRDFSLQVKPGQRIALVGPTGCGKTTMINLLMRFYDVDGGSISVDQTDIRHAARKSLRGSYGMVLQDTWLRSGTIRENICMARPDCSEEEMIAAAKASHAHSFIRRLPEGYDTVITEDGGSLSQGQKQLLCITRVMLCQPDMLILDEATSSIDTRTEILIQNAFARLMKGHTSFIVAHRLSTIRGADVILVMNQGNIVEQGTHEELLAKKGFYAKLYNSQFA